MLSKDDMKKLDTQKQIDENLSFAQSAEDGELHGKKCRKTKIVPMPPYSNKCMTVDDQFVLAVDKVEAPEVKAGLIPCAPVTANYLDPDAEIYDHATRLSLNNGDEGALKTLTGKLQSAPLRHYSFKDSQRPFNVGNKDFVLVYPRRTDAGGVAVFFDMYDDGALTENPLVPSVSVSMEIGQGEDAVTGKSVVKWEYVVHFHTNVPDCPKDTILKNEYAKMQSFMRGIIATMAIVPSRL